MSKKVRKALKMAKNRKTTRLISAALLMTILISAVFTLYLSAAGTRDLGSSLFISEYDGKLNTGIEKYYNSSVMYKLPSKVKDDDKISLIIDMPTVTLLDAYNSSKTDATFSEFLSSEEAAKVQSAIDDDAGALRVKLFEAGIDYELGESYSTILSGFEMIITARDFEAVCKTVGKSANVIVGEEYNPAKTELVSNTVNVQGTGIFDSSDFEYDGTGMVVAVLDTGLDYYHSAFSDRNFTADRSKLGLTFAGVADILASKDTAAERLQAGLTASDVYISEKVPFAFDYADSDSDVFPLLSNHGTHVAGVIAGNDDQVAEVTPSGEELYVVGASPNAQLAIMKIFSDVQSTARTSWILAALEDCVNLEVDVINMSIGTACGFSRESDKYSENLIYDRIRAQGISMVVAASNSFNSAYSSDKNGNLPLTSNPDSATVGSPSTYDGTISVASIEGAKTPYLTFNGEIIYFLESTDRFSEERDFVAHLLGSTETSKEMEYVTIPGAGRTADYTGIDVTGKIALVKRGHTTFEEKANVAEEMGAAAVIIYNNVSGDIRMNVGETSIAVASISQNDGELLAKQSSGTIVISKLQTSGPFMSDFSSWGPTPDLGIKPEITAHGGSILSAVPGQSYDRISGTSMASPNVAGLTALLRQYVVENFPDIADDPKQVAAFVNQLMMSTADIVINKNGLPYSVRKQGAGLANLTKSSDTKAYIITYDRTTGSAMNKSKIELGDDPTRSGVYNLTFSIKNFGDEALTYHLSTFVLTEGVNETKTAQGETTVTESAYSLDGATTSFTVSGGTSKGMFITVNKNSTATVTLTITLSDKDKKYLNDSFKNGMYVEGYVVLNGLEDTVDLSVPYLAFYGDWTKAPLFDLDYFQTNRDELDDSIDLLDKTLPDAYATRPIGGTTDDYVSYLGSYYFTQNPADKIIAADRKYISLSNQTDAVNSLRYVWAGLLRNAQRVEVVITEDATGEVVYTTTDYDVRKSYGDGGPIYPANVDIEFSAIEHNLKNNTAYTVNLKGYLDYGDGGADTNANNEFSFPLVTDFEAPIITGCEFYTEYDKDKKETRLFAKMAVYDNHYSMAMQIGQVGRDANGEAILNGFDKYLTPVYSDFNGTTYVTYELTDHIDDIKKSINKNTFTVVCYDYALNTATYEIALPDDYIDFTFEEKDVTLSVNQTYKLQPSVYPSTQWAEFITYRSSNEKVARVVGDEIIAVGPGKAKITATIQDSSVGNATLNLTVLGNGQAGFEKYDKPVVNKFEITGYYVNKAYYMLATEDRDIGSTGDEAKFASPDYLALSMFPSESVTLRYDLLAYFPNATEVVFETANDKVVKVDKNGTVTAVDEGFSSITIKILVDGESTIYSKNISIEVKEPWVTSGPSLSHYYGTGINGKVTFPDDLAITEIGQFAFSNFDYVAKDPSEISEEDPEATKMWYIGDNSIKEVIIPEGIERIGPYAFAGLTALKEITIPSTLETIDYGAFYGCTSLEKINGIENVKFINQAAFYGCAIKGKLDLKNVVAISDSAFAYNAKIESVVLPTTIQSVGANAFAYNTSLKSLTVNAEIIKLGKYAFDHCGALESVSVNAAVIPEGIFNECKALRSVSFGKDVAVIAEYAFHNTAVDKLSVAEGNPTFSAGNNQKYLTDPDKTEILLVAPAITALPTNIPATVTSIANAAFSGNTRITTVNLPNVTSVGAYAFAECSALSNVTLGKLTNIGEYAFENTAITTLPSFDSNTDIGAYAFSGTKVTAVTIPDGMTVPEGMFADCLSLSSVTVGNNVTLGKKAFAINPWNYTIVESDYDKQYYNTETGKLEYIEGYLVYSYAYLSGLTSLTIGNDAIIGEGAFYGAANITSVTLGTGAKIGKQAFYNNTKLENIDLSGAVSIGDEAFSGSIHYQFDSQDLSSQHVNNDGTYGYSYHAPALKEINLSALEHLGDSAFAYNRLLERVTFGKKLEEIAPYAFQGCNKLTVLVNVNNISLIGDYAFAECDILALNLSSTEKIGKYAFCYNENLTSLTLGNAVVIDEGAFSYCEALADLSGEDKATYFGDYAFAYTLVNDLDLSAATYIGKLCFFKRDYTELNVTLGDALTDIGDNPFANSHIAPISATVKESFNGKDFESITYTFDLGDSVKIIDGSIYKSVKNGLVLITWAGDSVANVADRTVRISDMAFAGSNVTRVSLPYTVASIGHKAFYECDSLVHVTFTSYNAPILEEEYDYDYYSSLENMPFSDMIEGLTDHTGKPLNVYGLGITDYFMWNATSLPTNVYYGASFVDYIGHVDNKITMVRPVNGKNYGSFIFSQYFNTVLNGAAAADKTTLAAIDAIGLIPTNAKDIKLEHKPIIEAARAAYNAIAIFEQRALVSDDVLAVLTNAEQRISDLEHLASGGTGDGVGDNVVTVPDNKLSKNAIWNIVIGSVFTLAVIAFVIVLTVCLNTIKKERYPDGIPPLSPAQVEKREKLLEKLLIASASKPVDEKKTVTEKLKKPAPEKLKDYEDIAAELASGPRIRNKKKFFITLAASVLCLVLIVVLAVVIINNQRSYLEEFDGKGYNVSVTFDSNGGTFKGSDASIIDLFKVEDFANGGVKLLAPDDPKRDKSNALTVSKANHFLAGWYTERALIDENDPSKGYTYSGKWDFSSDVLTIDTTKSYTAENSVLTLYAAWVPYYVYEIYAENESGDMALVASTSAINLTIPEWKDGDTSLSMDNFPKRSGYTLNEVFYDEDMTDKVVGTPDKNGKKKTITGEWDAATATSLTPTIKLYTTWDEGERYKIYTAEDLRKNAVAHGYYEIYADLDFTATAWPTVFTDGKFTGTIIGLDDNKTPTERKITGISIESSSRNRLNNGIFGTIDEGARIEKITFENIVHTVNVMEVAPGASFGLFAGSVNGTVIFKDVTVKGKIVIGDNCAELIGTDAVYTISTLAGNGDVSGITHDITTEKANKDNVAFDFEVAEDGTITLKAGSN